MTARIKLLELPERAQRMIGEGTLPLASIEPLRAIGAVSAEILDVVVNHVHGGGWGASRFVNEPGYVLAEALRISDTFGAYLTEIDGRHIEALTLGKRASAQYKEIVAWTRSSVATPTLSRGCRSRTPTSTRRARRAC